MEINSFFEALEHQYNKQLPFVVYSRPINSIINSWLQSDNRLHTTTTFTESGFVFAPFNLSNKTVLFPKDNCEFRSIESKAKIELKDWGQFVPTDSDFINKKDHLDLVLKGISDIEDGYLEKVVLSRIEAFKLKNVNPVEVFKRLYNTYKNAMVYCWYHPKVGLWLGATPELLFKVEGQQLTTIALAGTQPNNNASQVKWANKEIDEQQIVVDYIIHQIKPYAKSINVSEVETISAGSLLHLKSRITSRVDDNANLRSIIEALHPTPAVCGFPKQGSKAFILEYENYDREYYTGFLGELNLKQSKSRNTNRRNVENNAYAVVKTQSNFYVNLRCAQIKDEKALIYVGGGITKDSIAEKEWEETVSKTKTMHNVLG
ncbi:chorismate-binding protein [uncultured Winogradskyella sp.]|uniref:chorismate-binding protein n=1 Tax=uncultured Winogradskyella sp. TaxID=395353 RepID=UPI002621C8ED|nr:chorismate-binding protein [uncultured Winogradskyella sp.]